MRLAGVSQKGVHWPSWSLWAKRGSACLLAFAIALVIIFLPLKLAMALVLGVVALVRSLTAPQWGLYFLVFSIPFGSLAEVQIGSFTLSSTEVLVALVICSWLAHRLASGQVRTVHPPPLLPFLLFLGIISLTFAVALSLSASVKELLKWLEMVAIYLLVASTTTRKQARIILLLLLLAGCSQVLVGFYQFLARKGPESFLFSLGGRLMMRAYGTFGQPNPYGGYLGLILPLAYGLFVANWSMRRRETSSWLLGGVSLGLLGLGMLMTFSRGAWLGFLGAFLVMNLFLSPRAAFLPLIVGLSLGGAVILLGDSGVLPPFILQRLTDFFPYLGKLDVRQVVATPENWAVIERLAHWQAAWEMFSDHPWLGVGIGNYAVAYPGYALPGWEDPLGHAHNYYLNVAAEAGIVGLVAYLSLFVAIFWHLLRTLGELRGYWRGVMIGILGVLTALCVHNLLDNLYVQGMNVQIGMVLGLAYAIGRGAGDET